MITARAPLLAMALLLLTGGCAALPADAPPPLAPPLAASLAETPAEPAALARAERIAEALVQAATAERAADTAALARAAQRLERLGAAPQTAADEQTMERWLASIGSDLPPLRGRALGPAYRSAALDPGAATELNQTFFGGRSAQIVVRSVKGAGLSLVVEDQANRAVCKADDDPATCRWVPLYTQRHRIRIVNKGPAVSEFYIVFD